MSQKTPRFLLISLDVFHEHTMNLANNLEIIDRGLAEKPETADEKAVLRAWGAMQETIRSLAFLCLTAGENAYDTTHPLVEPEHYCLRAPLDIIDLEEVKHDQ